MSAETPSRPQSLKSVQIIRDENGTYEGYLVIRHIDETSKEASYYGRKLPISGPLKSRAEVHEAGDRLYDRYMKGDISIPEHSEKGKLRGYKITGRARFDASKHEWEPILELKKIEAPNKGQAQVILGSDTVFGRNLFAMEETAAKFAVETGKRMILGLVNGLDI
jgi:hypothetical protein